MVNVTDFKNMIPEGDMLQTLFNRQGELVVKYHLIEEKALGYQLPKVPYDLQSPKAQFRLKDFAWRVTEELAEALECVDQEDQTHFLEEIIDAMHFFVELLIYVGFDAPTLADMSGVNSGGDVDLLAEMWELSEVSVRSPQELAWFVVEGLGKAMNCLKNKPWKQTHMVTDEKQFKRELVKAWMEFICLLKNCGYEKPEGAVMLYLNKNDVNKFRIRSAY